MERLSRDSDRFSRWLFAAIAIIAFCICETFATYLFILNGRLTRQLVHHTWRAPTILLSAAHDAPSRPAPRDAADIRVPPPTNGTAFPPPVPNSFLAAENVRFRHHLGIDPIGM